MDKEEVYKYIKKHFRYDPKTGIITRDDRKNSTGSLDVQGYLMLKVKGYKFRSHRIAWFLYYGHLPQYTIDHINRIRTDNRLCNLRDVPISVNNENVFRLPNHRTGVVGVYEDTCTKGLKKKYTTRYRKKTYRFYTLEEAVNFRKEHNLITSL